MHSHKSSPSSPAPIAPADLSPFRVQVFDAVDRHVLDFLYSHLPQDAHVAAVLLTPRAAYAALCGGRAFSLDRATGAAVALPSADAFLDGLAYEYACHLAGPGDPALAATILRLCRPPALRGSAVADPSVGMFLDVRSAAAEFSAVCLHRAWNDFIPRARALRGR